MNGGQVTAATLAGFGGGYRLLSPVGRQVA